MSLDPHSIYAVEAYSEATLRTLAAHSPEELFAICRGDEKVTKATLAFAIESLREVLGHEETVESLLRRYLSHEDAVLCESALLGIPDVASRATLRAVRRVEKEGASPELRSLARECLEDVVERS